MKLAEEILEENTNYGGILGFMVWTITSIIVAPWSMMLVFDNNTQNNVNQLAVDITDFLLEEE